MNTSILLYGSRARGDAGLLADYDILVAPATGGLRSPRHFGAVSIHVYPQDWLLDEARNGSLFIMHLVREALPMFDPSGFLDKLQLQFRRRENYAGDRKLSSLIIMLLLSSRWQRDDYLVSRMFWAMRTLVIAHSADFSTQPGFSHDQLELHSGISGLSRVLSDRTQISAKLVENIAYQLVNLLGDQTVFDLSEDKILSRLRSIGGIGLSTAQRFEGEAAAKDGERGLYV